MKGSPFWIAVDLIGVAWATMIGIHAYIHHNGDWVWEVLCAVAFLYFLVRDMIRRYA